MMRAALCIAFALAALGCGKDDGSSADAPDQAPAPAPEGGATPHPQAGARSTEPCRSPGRRRRIRRST